jgi:hypothetical protein
MRWREPHGAHRLVSLDPDVMAQIDHQPIGSLHRDDSEANGHLANLHDEHHDRCEVHEPALAVGQAAVASHEKEAAVLHDEEREAAPLDALRRRSGRLQWGRR